MSLGRELWCGLGLAAVGLAAVVGCGQRAEPGSTLRRGAGTDSTADENAADRTDTVGDAGSDGMTSDAADATDVIGMDEMGSASDPADAPATSDVAGAGGPLSPGADGAVSQSADGTTMQDAPDAMLPDASVSSSGEDEQSSTPDELPRDPADAGGPAPVAPAPDAGVEGAGGATSEATDGSGGEPDVISEIPEVVLPDGPFKMLVYSKTNGFRSQDAIVVGQNMLTEIADEYDFDVAFTENNDDFTPERLAQYEVVFFLNTSGDVLEPAEEDAFQDWMEDGGAFVGTYRAANTEEDWAFYKELTGQFISQQSVFVALDIQWTPEAANFPGVAGMPSPWNFNSTWFIFDQYREWSTGFGFQILATVEFQGDTFPVSFAREYSNFRSFYVAMGHQASTFEDPLFKQFVTGGILWSVRRSSWLQTTISSNGL